MQNFAKFVFLFALFALANFISVLNFLDKVAIPNFKSAPPSISKRRSAKSIMEAFITQIATFPVEEWRELQTHYQPGDKNAAILSLIYDWLGSDSHSHSETFPIVNLQDQPTLSSAKSLLRHFVYNTKTLRISELQRLATFLQTFDDSLHVKMASLTQLSLIFYSDEELEAAKFTHSNRDDDDISDFMTEDEFEHDAINLTTLNQDPAGE